RFPCIPATPPATARAGWEMALRRVECPTSVAQETAVLGLAKRSIIRAAEIEHGVAGYLA
ncbi:MAG: hypothetical protein ACK595_04525, partial [Planctomycetota bacterium]